MRFYQEITLLPDIGTPKNEIIEETFRQLHLAITDAMNKGKGVYGISFPEYEKPTSKKNGDFGDKIRVFAKTEEEIDGLDLERWMEQLDFIDISEVLEVPESVSFAQYIRKQPLFVTNSRIRRFARRHNVSFDEAKKTLKSTGSTKGLPFIACLSISSKQNFKFYIEKKESKVANSDENQFNGYGLGGFVPEFE